MARSSRTSSGTGGNGKRPGVDAAIELVSAAKVNVSKWVEAERCGNEILQQQQDNGSTIVLVSSSSKYNPDLLRQREEDMDQLALANKEYFEMSDLEAVVSWKFTVGKSRIYNLKHIRANTSAEIEQCSRKAFTCARTINPSKYIQADGSLTSEGVTLVQEAMEALEKLRGVGPATASAMLTLINPQIFSFMYDEVIDCFESKRGYKISTYLLVNTQCMQLAHQLGKGWTPHRVAKVLWTTARRAALIAAGGGDGDTGPTNKTGQSKDKKRAVAETKPSTSAKKSRSSR